MRSLTLIIPVLSALLTACGGNSSSSSPSTDNTPNNTLPAGTICYQNDTTQLQGISIRISDYDSNNDGCLTPDEFEPAINYISSELARRQESRRVSVTGVNNNSAVSRIHSIRFSGNSESIDNVAQVHANLENGEFQISAEIYWNGNPEEIAFFEFSQQSALEKTNSLPGLPVAFIPPITGNITVILACDYHSDFSISCSHIIIHPTNSTPPEGVQFAEIDYSLDLATLGLTLNQASKAIILVCAQGQCYENYAEVDVAFN